MNIIMKFIVLLYMLWMGDRVESSSACFEDAFGGCA